MGGGAAATRNVVVDASSELPPGGGLGSSAALGVAIARAVCAVVDGDAIEPSVIARADAWERVFHGNPSGIDTAASVRGGCLRFVRGAGATDATLARELRLCVGWSGRSSSTRVMVERVAALRERDADRVDRDLDAIAALVEGAVVALSAGDLAALGERMDRNQSLLGGLGVSTPAIEAMCDAARGAGALGAKLTGAGGGGSVIALLRSSDDGGDDPAAGEAVLDAWRAAGFDGFVTRVRRGAAEVR